MDQGGNRYKRCCRQNDTDQREEAPEFVLIQGIDSDPARFPEGRTWTEFLGGWHEISRQTQVAGCLFPE